MTSRLPFFRFTNTVNILSVPVGNDIFARCLQIPQKNQVTHAE